MKFLKMEKDYDEDAKAKTAQMRNRGIS